MGYRCIITAFFITVLVSLCYHYILSCSAAIGEGEFTVNDVSLTKTIKLIKMDFKMMINCFMCCIMYALISLWHLRLFKEGFVYLFLFELIITIGWYC